MCKAMVGLTAAAFVVTVLYAAPAMASEGGHELRWGDLAWRFVNLIIFAAILWHFLGKLCVKFFRGRRQGIQDGIDELTAKREAAQARLTEIEARIANLDAEREAILAESKKQAETLKEDIVKQAHVQAKQIVEMAKVTAESEANSIVQQLRATIADELIDATRENLVASLNKSKHEKLIENSLKKVVLQ
ncbi:MAG: ATP synthase F0 subunit B [Desulfovibrionaceae bacterium]|nr:ATP synthase F0 subunit B [Desulfovibrionaceae bacterium]